MANVLQKINALLSPKSTKFFTSNLLYNRSVLYFFLIITVLDLYYLSVTNDFSSVALFIITGVLVSYFNTNMIVIMVIGLSVMHMLRFGIKATLNEGMKNKDGLKTKYDDEEDDDENDNVMSDNKNDYLEKKKVLTEINEEMTEFDNLQKKILKGLSDISPLMDKAENFIEKMESKYPPSNSVESEE
uniref:Uncharacterized protein n=1 Tax=viral metagenome TaxID=1070528 RepID=A0A6C0DR61_9ZZZZ